MGIDALGRVVFMRRKPLDRKQLTDPAAAHIEVEFYPYEGETLVAVTVCRGVGSRVSRLRVWTCRLSIGRGDLRGADPRTVTRLLCGELWDALADPHPNPIAQGADSAAGGVGAPLGATGGATFTQPQLPLELVQ